MRMTIDTVIKDCEQSIKQSELFIKTHQANMEIGEIKEYQYYIERDKLTIDTMHKYQKVEQILNDWENSGQEDDPINILDNIIEVIEDGKID